MKSCKNIVELRKEFASVKSVVAGDTRFIAQALMFVIEQNSEILKQQPKEKTNNGKRKRSIKGNEVFGRTASDCEGKDDQSRADDESSLEIHKTPQPTGSEERKG